MSKVIYKLTPDVNNYRTIFPDNEEHLDPALWKSTGTSKEASLINFNAHFNRETDTPVGNFSALNLIALALDNTVATILSEQLEASGELLPLKVSEQTWYYYNVTRIVTGFLDMDKSEFLVPSMRLGLQQAVFVEEKIPKRSCIFKIPEDKFENTYVLDSRADDKDVLSNFFCAVKAHSFTGLRFEEVARFD